MNSHLTAILFLASLLAAVFIGFRIRRRIPQDHLNADSKDVIKSCVGVIATMSALLLGLLVSSSKNSYDTTRGNILQMAAKLSTLDRLLAACGPDAEGIREQLRVTVADGVQRMWSEGDVQARLTPDSHAGPALFAAIQKLPARDEAQQSLKSRAGTLAMELGEIRSTVRVQSTPSVSGTLLVAMASWFIIIFAGYSIMTPPNVTVSLSLMLSALVVSIAIFLVLEFDRPFEGIVSLSRQPLLDALGAIVHSR